MIDALDSEISLNSGMCIKCGFMNKKPFKKKSAMTESELFLLEVYKAQHPKEAEERAIIPIKYDGFWASVCQPCFKTVSAP